MKDQGYTVNEVFVNTSKGKHIGVVIDDELLRVVGTHTQRCQFDVYLRFQVSQYRSRLGRRKGGGVKGWGEGMTEEVPPTCYESERVGNTASAPRLIVSQYRNTCGREL